MCQISVIIPVYNAVKYLDECLKMLINQTFKDFEVIFINDGSTDSTEEMLKYYSKIDDRIIVINKDNSGAWESRNYGIEASEGKYIVFIDCDDYFDEFLLETMYQAIESNKLDLVVSGHIDVSVYKNRRITKYKVPVQGELFETKEDFLGNIIKLRSLGVGDTLWNKIYRADIIKNNGIRFQPFRRGEDVIFNLNYYNNVNSCLLLDEYHYYYRVEKYNLPWQKYSNNFYQLVEDEYQKVREKLSNWGQLNDEALKFQGNHLMIGFIDHIKNLIKVKKFSTNEIIDEINAIKKSKYFQEGLNHCSFPNALNKLFIKCIRSDKLEFAILVVHIKLLIIKLKHMIGASILFSKKENMVLVQCD